jgi:LAO/AO transport system kinase
MGGERPWAPPILTTVASRGSGIAELLDAVLAHRAHLESGDGLERTRQARRRGELRAALAAVLARRSAAAAAAPEHRRLVALVEQGQLDPWTAAERLLGQVAST